MKGIISVGKNKIWKKDKVFYLKFCDSSISDESANAISEAVDKEMLSTPRGKRSMVVDLGDMINLSMGARALFTKKIKSIGIQRMALVFSNPVTRILASFFVRLNKPETKIKLFPKMEDAEKWIRE